MLSIDSGVDTHGSAFSVTNGELHWSLVDSINDKSSWASDWVFHTWSFSWWSWWCWWSWGNHVQVTVWSVGTTTSSDGSVELNWETSVVESQTVANVCWDTSVDGDIGVSEIGSNSSTVSLTVLFSSSVEDGISRAVIRVGSNIAHVSITVWFTWWIDGWIKAGIAVTTASLK